jgi:hypothetical protein
MPKFEILNLTQYGHQNEDYELDVSEGQNGKDLYAWFSLKAL